MITTPFYAPALDILAEYCEVEVHTEARNMSGEELSRRIAGKDGLICRVENNINKTVLENAPALRVIITASVGYDHIDLPETTKRGIYVCNSPFGPVESTADVAFGLLIASARRIVEADKYLRSGKWKEVSPVNFLGASVSGKTIGLIGFGRIGRAVAQRAKGFSMKILYTDVAPVSPEVEKEFGAEFQSLEELLRNSDFVSIHVPLSPTNIHIINEKTLSFMKPTAILINTSRGKMVDESALLKALTEKWIHGAALDVHEHEPTKPDDPFLALDNVILLPHIGSSTQETREKTELMAAESLIAVLQGKPPLGLINPEVERTTSLEQVKMI